MRCHYCDPVDNVLLFMIRFYNWWVFLTWEYTRSIFAPLHMLQIYTNAKNLSQVGFVIIHPTPFSFDFKFNPKEKAALFRPLQCSSVSMIRQIQIIPHNTTKHLNTFDCNLPPKTECINLFKLMVENNPLVAFNIVDFNIPLITVYKTNTKANAAGRQTSQSWPTASCCRLTKLWGLYCRFKVGTI